MAEQTGHKLRTSFCVSPSLPRVEPSLTKRSKSRNPAKAGAIRWARFRDKAQAQRQGPPREPQPRSREVPPQGQTQAISSWNHCSTLRKSCVSPADNPLGVNLQSQQKPPPHSHHVPNRAGRKCRERKPRADEYVQDGEFKSSIDCQRFPQAFGKSSRQVCHDAATKNFIFFDNYFHRSVKIIVIKKRALVAGRWAGEADGKLLGWVLNRPAVRCLGVSKQAGFANYFTDRRF